jgi:hypothetical protein
VHFFGLKQSQYIEDFQVCIAISEFFPEIWDHKYQCHLQTPTWINNYYVKIKNFFPFCPRTVLPMALTCVSALQVVSPPCSQSIIKYPKYIPNFMILTISTVINLIHNTLMPWLWFYSNLQTAPLTSILIFTLSSLPLPEGLSQITY